MDLRALWRDIRFLKILAQVSFIVVLVLAAGYLYFNVTANLARQGLAVGDLKRKHQWPTRSPEREAEVLARVRGAVAGPLSATSAERIFTLIIKETSAVQETNGDEDFQR